MGRPRAAGVLGVAPSAIYLQVGDTVLALVTADAIRLPCALVLPNPSVRRPLTALAPDGAHGADGLDASVTVGGGRLNWLTGGLRVEVAAVREWPVSRMSRCQPRADRVAELESGLADHDFGVDPGLTAGLTDDRGGAVLDLLGRGPGLTPAGDDVLCGYLLATAAFGVDAGAVCAAVSGLANARTTALSAALLRHALAGECTVPVSRVIAALGKPVALAGPLAELLAIGHTSGAALAHGIAVAATARVPAVAA
jgi:Protein of unknown function (DUF2877)